MSHQRSVSISVSLALAATVLAEPTFVDRSSDLGLTLHNSAAAWGDVDGDGWIDLYNAGTVWMNEKGKRFRAVKARGRGLIADVDNDGRGDLVSFAPVAILRNSGDGAFQAMPLAELPDTVSRGAACADFNNDGFLDVYFGGYENWEDQITYPDLLLLGDEGKRFELRLDFDSYRARGVTACDYDEDGDVDVYVSNYRLQPNLLWQNCGDAELKNVAKNANAVASSDDFRGGHSIGACFGDFDNDGRIDLFAGNFAHVDSRGDQPKSRFLRNLGPKQQYAFEDLGTCGVFYQESYASPAAGDYDNDGDLDLYFTTVYADASFGKKNHPVLYRNEGDFTFVNATEGTGLGKLPPTYQAAWADFDRDGDLDLVTAGRLFVNEGVAANWIEVRLVGDGGSVNHDAFGAQARLELDERTLTRQVEAGTGEGNANSPILHFGLGGHDEPVVLEITWPNGERQVVRDLASGVLHTIRYEPLQPQRGKAKTAPEDRPEEQSDRS